jgi:hypothetical protein
MQKIKALPSRSILSPENLAAYEIMWKNVVEPDATEENTGQAQCILGT